MRTNKIVRTIAQLYKMAAPNQSNQELSNQQKKDILDKGHIVLDKLQKGEILTREDRLNLQRLDDLLEAEHGYVKDMEDHPDEYRLRGDANTIRQERRINLEGSDLEDYKTELLENPLFPGKLFSRKQKNYFSMPLINAEIEKEKKYIDREASSYRKANATLTSTQQIISNYDTIEQDQAEKQEELQKIKAERDQHEEQLKKLKEQEQFHQGRLNEIDEDMGISRQKVKEDIIDEAYPHLLAVWEFASNLDSFQQKLSNTEQQLKKLQQRISQIDVLKEKNKDYRSLLPQNKSYDDLVADQKTWRDAITRLEARIKQAKMVQDGNVNDAHMTFSGEPIYWEPAELDDGTLAQLTWEEIEEYAKYIQDVQKDQKALSVLVGNENQDGRIQQEKKALTRAKRKTDEIQADLDVYTNQLNMMQDNYLQATHIMNGVDEEEDVASLSEAQVARIKRQHDQYIECKKIVETYEEHQQYLILLTRYKSTIQHGKKDENIPPESAQSLELANKIEEIKNEINNNRDDYLRALGVNPSERSAGDITTINLHEKKEKELKNTREKKEEVDRTISQKLHDVDVRSVDVEKVKDSIVRRVIASKALLGTLLTQSVSKFVMEYLHNTNYVKPELEKPLHKLIHLYELKDGEAPELSPKDLTSTTIQNFADPGKNEQLLNRMILPLLQEKETNLFQMFLDVLHKDYKPIYDAFHLSVSGSLYFVVNPNKNYRWGPATLKEIKQRYGFERGEPLKVNDEFFLTDINDYVKVIKEKATGLQMLNFFNNDQFAPIIDIFKQVERLFKEYIRERLKRAAYEICQNTGGAFYSVALAATLAPNIANVIRQENIDKWLKTSNKNTSAQASTVIKNNIQQLKDELIKKMCEDLGAPNKYLMLVKFLELHGVTNAALIKQDNESNKDYFSRLKTELDRMMSIFEQELVRKIQERINLCGYELEARDKKRYNEVTSRTFSMNNDETYQKYLNMLSGYTNEKGEKVLGLKQQIKDVDTNLNKLERKIETIVKENLNNEDDAVRTNKTILEYMKYGDNFDQLIQKKTAQLNQYENYPEEKKKQLGTNISYTRSLVKILKKIKDEGIIRNYQELKKKQEQLYEINENVSEYLTSFDKNSIKLDSTIEALSHVYSQLFGKRNNPIKNAQKYIELKNTLSTLKSEDPKYNVVESEISEAKRRLTYNYESLIVTLDKSVKDIESDVNISSGEKKNRVTDLYRDFGLYGKYLQSLRSVQDATADLTTFIKEKEENGFTNGMIIKLKEYKDREQRLEKRKAEAKSAERQVEDLKTNLVNLTAQLSERERLMAADQNEKTFDEMTNLMDDNISELTRQLMDIINSFEYDNTRDLYTDPNTGNSSPHSARIVDEIVNDVKDLDQGKAETDRTGLDFFNEDNKVWHSRRRTNFDRNLGRDKRTKQSDDSNPGGYSKIKNEETTERMYGLEKVKDVERAQEQEIENEEETLNTKKKKLPMFEGEDVPWGSKEINMD